MWPPTTTGDSANLKYSLVKVLVLEPIVLRPCVGPLQYYLHESTGHTSLTQHPPRAAA